MRLTKPFLMGLFLDIFLGHSGKVSFWVLFVLNLNEGCCCAVLSCSVVSDSLRPSGLYPTRLLCSWNSSGKNTGVVCHALLQGIFPTQGLNPGLPHCRQIFYCLSHQGSPRVLEWMAYSFSRGSSRPRNWTGVSCIAGGFFTSWATRKALMKGKGS